QDYLVGKHIFIAFGMIGRGTRGYVALEWKTQRFVFLKDSWRACYTGVESEGTILSVLNANGVTNVPTVVQHSDVFFPPDEVKPGAGLRHMVHTRLVVKEICLPLTAFTSSKQLVRIIYGCITAHGLAWSKCKYMHRDVSAGNLLIYPDVRRTQEGKYRIYWTGILADWELAKHADKKVATQPQRTGTWHFMSAYLLDHPGMPTTIADELEAFVHVLIYGLVR
ncbi:hypothetical protein K466DRAFT_440952, partial [Polyporus arcularius HHB13444]